MKIIDIINIVKKYISLSSNERFCNDLSNSGIQFSFFLGGVIALDLFAVNFGIPLISIVPDGDGDDRQSSLLKLVGADNSIVKIGDNISYVNPHFAEEVLQNNEQLRNKSRKWIERALSLYVKP